jgi:hypothetical protein
VAYKGDVSDPGRGFWQAVFKRPGNRRGQMADIIRQTEDHSHQSIRCVPFM